jgi:hypothetical protein
MILNKTFRNHICHCTLKLRAEGSQYHSRFPSLNLNLNLIFFFVARVYSFIFRRASPDYSLKREDGGNGKCNTYLPCPALPP